MIDHDVLAKESARDELARKMAEWEANHGPVVTQPPSVYRESPMMHVPDGATFTQSAEKMRAARTRGGIAGNRSRKV